jgi:hypothetical protein
MKTFEKIRTKNKRIDLLLEGMSEECEKFERDTEFYFLMHMVDVFYAHKRLYDTVRDKVY